MQKHSVYKSKLLVVATLIFWALVSIISVSESVLYYVLRARDVPWVTILIWDLNWPMWLLASLPVMQLVYKLVGRKRNWTHFAWQIVLVSVVLSVFHVLVEAALNFYAKTLIQEDATFIDVFYLILTYKVHVNVIITFTLAGVTIAWDAFNESKIHEQKSRQLEARAEELKRQLTEAQLEALRRQLRPHFLFNSMHLISGLILKKEYDKAMEMIAKLSDLLRHTLKYDEQQWITLDEEITLVRLYLEIHQVRFGPGLELNIDVPEDTKSLKVPTFILQPIVENSLVHGIEPNKNNGRVDIRCRLVNGRLEIEVADNGKGTSESVMIHEKIGIQNTRSRLTTLYGDNFIFKYDSPESFGFRTTIILPVLPKEFYAAAS